MFGRSICRTLLLPACCIGFVATSFYHISLLVHFRTVLLDFQSRIPPTGWARDPDLGVVPMEVYILKNVRHKNIVRFLDYIEDERFCILVEELHGTQWTKVGDRSKELVDEIDKMSISDARAGVAEAKATGLVPALVRTKSMDLFECIERHYRLPEKMAKRVFGQIADAVSYLHSKGVVHRDIKV